VEYGNVDQQRFVHTISNFETRMHETHVATPYPHDHPVGTYTKTTALEVAVSSQPMIQVNSSYIKPGIYAPDQTATCGI